jgi:hypothetical protein
MNEKVHFKVEIVLIDEPEIIEKLETKFVNLSLKENVVSFFIKKTYL